MKGQAIFFYSNVTIGASVVVVFDLVIFISGGGQPIDKVSIIGLSQTKEYSGEKKLKRLKNTTQNQICRIIPTICENIINISDDELKSDHPIDQI